MKKAQLKNRQTMLVDDFMDLPYPVVITKTKFGDFIAELPDLPGCFAGGDSEEEALEMLRDAQRGWIEDEIESGREVPLPDTSTHSGNILIRTSGRVHESLVKQAKLREKSLNSYVCNLLTERVTVDLVMKRIDELSATVKGLEETVDQQSRRIAELSFRLSVGIEKPIISPTWHDISAFMMATDYSTLFEQKAWTATEPFPYHFFTIIPEERKHRQTPSGKSRVYSSTTDEVSKKRESKMKSKSEIAAQGWGPHTERVAIGNKSS